MAEPFVGSIIAVGFNFAPVGWLPCDGSLYPISEYEVLFTLLGTTYGGNGTTNFAVPDLRGRGALGAGQSPGLSNYILGQPSGTESVTLTTSNMPQHSHLPMASPNGTTSSPGSSVAFGASTDNASLLYAAPGSPATLSNAVIGISPGGNVPHGNMQPFNTVNYIIAAFGIYPSPT